MIVNGLTILTWMLSATIGCLIAHHFAEKDYRHKLDQIQLINTVEIEESMRRDGWSV